MSDNVKDAIDSSREAAQWTWITATDSESRRRAKSHTSREVKRRKAVLSQRAGDRKAGRRKPLSLAPAKLRPNPEPAQSAVKALSPNPASPLGAGRIDPFAQYPVFSESNELHELVDHCEFDVQSQLLRSLLIPPVLFTAPSLQLKPQKRVCFLPLFQEIRRVSFELAQNDPAAFHTILAIASADRSILHDEAEPMQAIAYSTHSIRLLNKRLSDAKDATADTTITTVALQVIFLVRLPITCQITAQKFY
jgi:hypothetical protein